MQFTEQHRQLDDTVTRFVRTEIDPHVDEWEAAQQFPAPGCCLPANTADGPAPKNRRLIIVTMHAAGIARQKVPKTGVHRSDTALAPLEGTLPRGAH